MSEDPTPYGVARDPLQVTFDRRAAARALRHLRPSRKLGIPDSDEVTIGAYPGQMVFATTHTAVAIEAFVMDPGIVTLRRRQVDHLISGLKEPKLTLFASAAGFKLGSISGSVLEYQDLPVTGLPEWLKVPIMSPTRRR